MQLCAITHRKLLGANEAEKSRELVKLAQEWAQGGVDYIQVREKDLSAAELEALVRRVVEAVGAASVSRAMSCSPTKVLVNGGSALASRAALGAGADGMHLPGEFTKESLAKSISEMRRSFAPRTAIVSVACHSLPDVEHARDVGADLVLFAPVFGKVVGASLLTGAGLESLATACAVAGAIPVFALGGVSTENARACADAGATGVAGIRLFLGGGWQTLRD